MSDSVGVNVDSMAKLNFGNNASKSHYLETVYKVMSLNYKVLIQHLRSLKNVSLMV
jgi:hypothetical protein